ncbi:MAG: linear amide C-N hydrolase [Treponema sp.]|nr:linear amide C-N hydrolase [Treponema sp.]
MRRNLLIVTCASLLLSSCGGEGITRLEGGLSSATVEGDYRLDEFLRGGAESDRGVVRFLLEGAGCSTIQLPGKDGGFFFGRNFDWNRCDALILTTKPESGYASISTVNTDFIKAGAGIPFLSEELLLKAAVYAPLDGMNEKGLCVSVNMIQDSATIDQRTGKPGLTTTTAIRAMLDKAATTDEALGLLSRYDMHASLGYMVHFAIADAHGKSVAVEYIDGRMSVVETPILTNFYVSEGKKYGIGTKQSHERFSILQGHVGNSAESGADVAGILESVSKHNFNEFESTEWSVVFDQKALTATYYHRERYGKQWTFSLRQ